MMNRLYRSDTDRILGGVCGGLAQYLRLNPLIVRILLVILAMTNGLGLAIYLIMWVLVPTEGASSVRRGQIVRQNVEEIGQRARKLGADAREALEGQRWLSSLGAGGKISKRGLIIGSLLIIAGLSILLDNLGLLWWFGLGKLWPLIPIAIGSVILLNNLKDRR